MKNLFFVICTISIGYCFTNIAYAQVQKSYSVEEIKNLDSLKPKFAPVDNYKGYFPKEGFVPDKATAIKITLAVWIPIYGEQTILEEKPYKAILKDK